MSGHDVQPHWVEAWAPGKINLSLQVGGREPDGYHELVTVFQAVDLGEHVTVRSAGDFRVVTRGRDAELVPQGPGNLAVRAARAIAEIGRVQSGAHIEVTKEVPVAGGMAGGSADAAATLVALDTLWGLHLGRGALHRIAERLGADVSFCLSGNTAVGTGRGEQLAPVLAQGCYVWAAALAHEGLSTPRVFERYDALVDTRPAPVAPAGIAARKRPLVRSVEPLLEALRTREPAQLGRHLDNALEAAALALRPELSSVLERFRQLDALGALVSGSGPTVVALAQDASHAQALAEAAGQLACVREAVTLNSPAPGAHVVEHG